MNAATEELQQDDPQASWVVEEAEPDEGDYIQEYDITSSASDFNVVTIGNFIESVT